MAHAVTVRKNGDSNHLLRRTAADSSTRMAINGYCPHFFHSLAHRDRAGVREFPMWRGLLTVAPKPWRRRMTAPLRRPSGLQALRLRAFRHDPSNFNHKERKEHKENPDLLRSLCSLWLEKRSTRQVYDQSKVQLAEFGYSPYGRELGSNNRALTTRGYTGHTRESALGGGYYAPFRYYMPSLARWEKRDPLGMVDGPNVYGYVRGDVVGHFDEFGLSRSSRCRQELVAAQGACYISLAAMGVAMMSIIKGASKCLVVCIVPTNPLCLKCVVVSIGISAIPVIASAVLSGLGVPDPADWTCKKTLCMLRDCMQSTKKNPSQSKAQCHQESSSSCSV